MPICLPLTAALIIQFLSQYHACSLPFMPGLQSKDTNGAKQ